MNSTAYSMEYFRPLILKKNAITYLDDVFMQSQTKEEMFNVLEHYHKILQNENLKAAPDKSHFFLTRVKFLGHKIERKTITPLKSRIDAFQKLQPPTNKKKIQEFLGMLNFLSKYVYKMQNNFEWNTEHQARFEEIKKLLTEQISNLIPDPNQPFYAMCDAPNFGIGAALLQSHNSTNKMNYTFTAPPPLFGQHPESNRLHNWALNRLQYRQDIHEDIRDHNIQILQQNSLQLKFEITIKLNNITQHPYPLNPPNITAQSLPPPFITTEVIYNNDRYTKKTIGYITFYNPYSGLSYKCIF